VALITDLDDRTLVEQHRSGDPDAFRRIVLRHHRSLYANALRRLGDPVAAEDAVQDAFLRAFRNIERFDGDYHLDAWLHRIVTNTCHDIGRRRGRDTRLFHRACTEVDVEAAPADEAALDAMPRQEITDALDSLPESYREVLVLRFVDELSYSDVAEQAGITEQNARARVSRGRNMLKRMLTSTSALVVWAIAPLRRQSQLSGAEAEAANQAAAQVHGLATIASSAPAPTQAFNQLSGIIAQAGPTIATAAPAVSTSGPTLKAAVAMGIAATVAIPTGVAVDRTRDKAPAPIAAEVEDESAAGPIDAPVPVDRPAAKDATATTVASGAVGTASSAEPTIVGSTGDVATDATAPSTSVAPATSEPDAATTDESEPDSDVEDPSAPATAPAPEPAAEEEPPPAAPVAGPPGQLSASVAISPAGNRLQLDGPLELEIDGQVIEGRLSGKLLVGAAGKDAQAPREVQRSDLFLDLDDGTRLVLVVKGTSTVTTEDGAERHALALTYTLDRAADYGLAEGGEIEGTLVVTGDRGELGLAIPGATETS
jgi:RNA polymerase sigma-70 factor, ECF subfamily